MVVCWVFFFKGEKHIVDSVDFVSDVLEGNQLQVPEHEGKSRRVAILCKPSYAGSVDSNSCFFKDLF